MDQQVMWDVFREDMGDLLFYWGPPTLGAFLGIALVSIGNDFWRRLWNSKIRFLLAILAGELGVWVFFILGMLVVGPFLGFPAQGLVFGVAPVAVAGGFCVSFLCGLAAALRLRRKSFESRPISWQFGLKAVLVAPLIVAIVFGTWYSTRRTRIERIVMEQNLREKWRPMGFIIRNSGSKSGPTGLMGDRKTLTDSKMRHLEGQTQLKYLDLQGTRITDAGMMHLKPLKNLSSLELGGTGITDAGMTHLGQLTSLRELTLDGTQVTDAGLRCLDGLPHLRYLVLQNTQITDAGLKHLSELPGLKRLLLGQTKTTAEGIAEFERELPQCSVSTRLYRFDWE